jgi:hypothetical protein
MLVSIRSSNNYPLEYRAKVGNDSITDIVISYNFNSFFDKTYFTISLIYSLNRSSWAYYNSIFTINIFPCIISSSLELYLGFISDL